jgi:hypothetical protein
MSQQSDAPCYEYQRMCKSFDDAVAEISRLRIGYESARNYGVGNVGEMQTALGRARSDGRAIRLKLENHLKQHGCKS